MFWPRPSNATAIAAHCRAKYNVSTKANWIAMSSAFTNFLSGATNVLFSNGQYDPWRSGGVLQDLSPTVKAIQVEQGAHHLDLFFSNPADPPSLRRVRDAEVAAMKSWLKA